jgi:predicted ATP-dependent endonuclease of OLD family
MKMRRIRIRNFRSFGDTPVEFPVNDITAFVGPNNSGKSNVLRALEMFFDYSKPRISTDCFLNGELNRTIEITVTFGDLSEGEKRTFLRHLSPDGTLTITQRIRIPRPDSVGEDDDEAPELSIENVVEDKYGIKVVASEEYPWLNIEKKPRGSDLKNWWTGDMTVNGVSFKEFCGNPAEPPRPEEFQQFVDRFWEEHFDDIPKEYQEGDTKVLGWANKLKGNLPNFIFIRAVRHLHEEFKVAKTNPFGRLLYWLLGDIDVNRRQALQERLEVAVTEIFATEDAQQQRRIDLVHGALNEYLQEQFENMQVEVRFDPPVIDDLLSSQARIIGHDGYSSDLSEKGQGVQRCAIFALLRTYVRYRSELEGTGSERTTIFAIEEPELCLHPPIKRATYALLRNLASGRDQVVYTTHDGYFVDVQYFDEVRIVRRTTSEKEETPVSTVSHFPIEHLVTDCRNRYGREVTKEALRQRFRRFYDPAKNEGFFAKRIILVEGGTEMYALPIYFDAIGFNIDREEVAIIAAESVDALGNLYIIFNELGIPCYVIFDADKPVEDFDVANLSKEKRKELKKKCERNAKWLKLFGASELIPEDEFGFPETTVHDRVTVFQNNFEVQVHHSLPNYATIKAEASKWYKDIKPLLARHLALHVVEEMPDAIPSIFRDMRDKIRGLQWPGSCLMLDD